MKSKKASLAINVIITATILLFVLFILMAILSDKFHFIAVNLDDCESKEASCVEESKCLPPLRTIPYKCEQTGKEKIVCCR